MANPRAYGTVPAYRLSCCPLGGGDSPPGVAESHTFGCPSELPQVPHPQPKTKNKKLLRRRRDGNYTGGKMALDPEMSFFFAIDLVLRSRRVNALKCFLP